MWAVRNESHESGPCSSCFSKGWFEWRRHGLQDGSEGEVVSNEETRSLETEFSGAVRLSGTDGLSTDSVSNRDNDYDDNVFEINEFENLTGVWRDILSNLSENDNEDERP